MKWYKVSVFHHIAVVAMSFVVVAILVFCTLNISFLNPIATAFEDFSVIDIYYQMHKELGDERKSRLVTIVDMTELTSRRDISNVINEIESYNPAVLGIDIVFEGLKEDTVGDNMLMDIADRHSNIVYSYKLQKYIDRQYTEEVHSFFTPYIPVTEGFTNFERKLYGGIKRKVTIGLPSKGSVKPSFALEVANMYAKQDVMPLENKQIELNFIPTDFNSISYREIGQHPECIDGRVVLLGATKDENDMHYTPLGKIAGVELLAYSVETLLNQKEIKETPLWLFVLISVIIVLLTEYVLSWYKRIVVRSPVRFIRSFLTSNIIVAFLIFVLMAIFFTIAYVLFCVGNYSINLGWAFSAMACLDSCQQFYNICIKKENL